MCGPKTTGFPSAAGSAGFCPPEDATPGRLLPTKTTVAASVSFDDHVMQKFASPWVKTMMSRMGLKDDLPIDSPMVSRGLHRALQKLAKKALSNMRSDSIEEWMRHNLPR